MRYVKYTLNQLNTLNDKEFVSTLFQHTENKSLKEAVEDDKEKIASWKDCLKFIKRFVSEDILRRFGEVSICFEYRIFDGTWVDAIIICDNKLIILEFKSGSDCRKDTLDGHRAQIIGYYNKITRCNRVIWQEMKTNPNFRVEKYLVYTNQQMRGKTDTFDYIKVTSDFKEVMEGLTKPASEDRVNALLEFEEELDITTTGVMRDILNRRLLNQMYVQDANVNACANIVEKIQCEANKATLNLVFIKGAPGAGKTGTGFSLLERYIEQGAKYVTGNRNLSKIFSQMIKEDKISGIEAAIVGSLHNLYDISTFCRTYQRNKNVIIEPCKNNLLIIDEAQRIWNPKQIAFAKKNELTDEEKVFVIEKEISEALLVFQAVFEAIKLDKKTRTIVLLIGSGQEIYIGEEDGERYIKAAVERLNKLIGKFNYPINLKLYLPTTDMFLECQALGIDCVLEPGLLLEYNKRNEYNQDALTFVNELIGTNTPERKNLRDAFMVYGSYEDLRRAIAPLNSGAFSIGIVGNGFDTMTARDPEQYWEKKAYLSLGGKRIFNIKNDQLIEFFINKSCNALDAFASQFNCQGLELDYVVMVWGNMMRRRGEHWEFSEDGIWAVDHYCENLEALKSKFPSLSSIAIDKNELRETFIKNCYRVLLTRARIATFIYCEDEETRLYLESCI